MSNCNPSATPTENSPFAAVRQRFEDWRQTRRPSSPIPEALWGEAVELAQEHGVNRTAQALRLSYASLRQHLEATLQGGSAVSPDKPAFVELISPLTAGMAECTIEWERPGEAAMRIHLKSATLPAVEALTRMFLSVQA